MDLHTFKFPKLNKIDMAFSTLRTDKALLAEAEARGFYGGNTPFNDLFSSLFFKGGKVNYRTDIPDSFKNDAGVYMRSFMGSFEPKHEEKEAICAMLLSELVTLEKETAK